MLTIEDVLGRLDCVRRSGPNQWSARCPAHEDRDPSLSVSVGEGGTVLLHCHAGCTFEQVREALPRELGLLAPVSAGNLDLPRIQRRRTRGGGSIYPDQKTAIVAVTRLVRQQPGRGSWSLARTHDYLDRDGRVAFMILRFEPPVGGAKTIRPVHRADDGWRLGLPEGQLPLYRWQELPATGRVFVVEGEGVADCAWGLGLPAVTSQGGARAARRSDWSPLRGRDVVIVPDADDAGARYAGDVAQELSGGLSSGFVSCLELPGLPPGGDLVDFVGTQRQQGLDDAAIKALVMSCVKSASPEERIPEGVPAYVPFPVDALGPTFGSFVSSASKALGCDPGMVALPLLASAASSIGNSRMIRIKEAWHEPPILWTVIVAESGSLKSPALDLAAYPLRRIEQDLQDEGRCSEHGASSGGEDGAPPLVWPAQRVLEGPWSNGRVNARIRRPWSRRLTIADATIEAVIEQLAANHRGLLLVRDELGAWFEGLRRYAKSPIGDASRWLEMFRAGRITSDRKTGPRKRIDVPRAALCIVGTLQPLTLRKVMLGQHEEDGLAARFLYVMPPPRQKQWTDEDLDATTKSAATEIMRRLVELAPEREGEHYITPKAVEFTAEARARWITFYDDLNRRTAETEGLMCAMLAKLEAYVARFALVLHCVRVAGREVPASEERLVSCETLERAIQIGEWAEQGARRTVAFLNASEARIVLWKRYQAILGYGGSTTVREWRRRRSLAGSDDARRELQALVDAGWAKWEAREPGAMGRPTERVMLVEGRNP